MKILSIITQKPSSTGSGIYLTEILKSYQHLGEEQAVICGVTREDKLPDIPSVDFFPVYYESEELPYPVLGMSDEMPYKSTRYKDLTKEMLEQFERAFSKKLEEVLSVFSPDLILCHHLYLLTALVRERCPQIPIFAFCHNTDLRQMEKHDLEKDRIIRNIQKLDKIFTMYYQVKDNIHRSAGSGIGLAISKNLAQLMQGDLTVESELDKGSTFYLTIIADKAQANEMNAETAMQHLSILLVEDVELNVVVAKSILEKQGHYVDVAMNGEQAIRLFEKNTYDIVFLDIKLPDMSGFDIAHYLRKNYEEGIYDFLPPLIAFTANVMHSEEEYQEQGMDGVLRKPLSLVELRQCFKTFLGDDIECISDEEELPQVQEGINISLIELIGKSQAKANVDLFKQWMPIYLDELETAYDDYLANSDMQQTVSDVAHKIKGAAASVGLVNVQNIAKQAQDTSLPNWTSDIASWIKQLSNEWPQNLAELEAYLEK